MNGVRDTIRIGALLLAATGAPDAHGAGRILTTSDVVTIRIVDHPDLNVLINNAGMIRPAAGSTTSCWSIP